MQKLAGSLPWLVKATPLTSLWSAHPSMIWDSGTCAHHCAIVMTAFGRTYKNQHGG